MIGWEVWGSSSKINPFEYDVWKCVDDIIDSCRCGRIVGKCSNIVVKFCCNGNFMLENKLVEIMWWDI